MACPGKVHGGSGGGRIKARSCTSLTPGCDSPGQDPPAPGHLSAPHPSLAPLLEPQRPLSEALTQMCTMYPEQLIKPALGHRAVQRETCPANVPRHLCSGPPAQTPPSPRGPLSSSLPRCTPPIPSPPGHRALSQCPLRAQRGLTLSVMLS